MTNRELVEELMYLEPDAQVVFQYEADSDAWPIIGIIKPDSLSRRGTYFVKPGLMAWDEPPSPVIVLAIDSRHVYREATTHES